jgi:hypothetical protein
LVPKPVLSKAEGSAILFWAMEELATRNILAFNILTAKPFVVRQLAEPSRQVIALRHVNGTRGEGVLPIDAIVVWHSPCHHQWHDVSPSSF